MIKIIALKQFVAVVRNHRSRQNAKRMSGLIITIHLVRLHLSLTVGGPNENAQQN